MSLLVYWMAVVCAFAVKRGDKALGLPSPMTYFSVSVSSYGHDNREGLQHARSEEGISKTNHSVPIILHTLLHLILRACR